jgi:hypothetical protein
MKCPFCNKEIKFIDLYDSGFETEKHPVVYFTKNRSKLNIKNGLGLSGLVLDRDFGSLLATVIWLTLMILVGWFV